MTQRSRLVWASTEDGIDCDAHSHDSYMSHVGVGGGACAAVLVSDGNVLHYGMLCMCARYIIHKTTGNRLYTLSTDYIFHLKCSLCSLHIYILVGSKLYSNLF